MGFRLGVVYTLTNACCLTPPIGVQKVVLIEDNQKFNPYNEVLETST